MAISMLKIRRPLGRLIFNMGIAIPGKTVFLIETAPWSLLIVSEIILIVMSYYKHIVSCASICGYGHWTIVFCHRIQLYKTLFSLISIHLYSIVYYFMNKGTEWINPWRHGLTPRQVYFTGTHNPTNNKTQRGTCLVHFSRDVLWPFY